MTDGDRLPPAPDVIERALTLARGHDCVVVVSDGSEADVRFANNTTTTNGVRRDRRVTVISFVAAPGAGRGRPGAASDMPAGPAVAVGVASRAGAVDVAELVRASEADAGGAAPADDAMPLVAPPGSTGAPFGAPPALTDLSTLDAVVRPLAAAFGRARSARHVLAGFASHRMDTIYLGSSTGLRLRHEQPTGTLQLVARSADGLRSTWAGVGSSRFDDVDVDVLHERLVRRLAWAERRLELPAGRYETILPPDATADLMVVLSQALSGRDAEDGRSPFSGPDGTTKRGEVLSSLPFTLRSDPAEPGLESIPFLVTTASGTDVSVFDNGLPVAPTAWVREGRLHALEYHRAAAARSGTVTTPPGDNLMLELPGATDPLDDLIARTERGLLLTCLWYIREVDPVTLLVTGLTRDGVYLVEGGEVVGAVNNFRFNESPIDVLARTTEAGRTERALSREWGEWKSRTAMPALRVADFNMSSVSPAT
ncbi:MAG TPA: metallopeptidase TldD-related protein [Acidimicrobiales bacterium]|nr:metallopeptidase TldD-related protein [Acidimicrobiales bacterium]